ncbi:MAG: YHS domain-containing protein [Pseudomonadota bacterium]|nr:YHS domain-containing protein [Pseudomonadota bacterium]
MQVECPVCHMQVPPDHLALVYQRMQFAFCSEQCRERFQATPHLYIGVPGQKAAKQEGREVLKHRCLRLDEPLSPEQTQILEDAVTTMMGVKQVVVEKDEVKITYDFLEATEEQIERTLLEAGARLGSGWTERLRRALVHYTEECEALNMEVSNQSHHH